MSSTKEQVQALLAEGRSRASVARTLGVSKATVSYHARRLGHTIDERCNRRYDWADIQAFYDDGHSLRDCQVRFGCARKTLMDAAARGALRTRPRTMPMGELLLGVRGRSHLKKRLLAAGLKEERCETCGLTEWRGAPVAFQLHHVNGEGDDNRLENLQLLCPNCHAQTENWGGRNRGSRSRGDREAA